MKPRLVTEQALFLLMDDLFQLSANHWVRPDGALIKHDHAIFRQRADGKFTVPGMPDFTDDKHIQRQIQRVRDPRCHYHSAARQSQYQVSSNPLLLEATTQPQSRVLA